MRQYESYKDSGVEWIGKIPSQWKTMPLKRYGHFNKGLTFTKAELVDEGNAVVSYGQVHSKQNSGTTLSDELIRYIPDSIANNDNSIVRQGDFIFADTSEDLDGSGNVVYIDRDEKIYGGYHTVLFQTPDRDNKFLAYLFTTDCWRSQIRSRVSGVKVFSITQSILGMSSIILPPVKEQQAMVAYLDEKASRIDRIIKSREEKIKLLEELRTSIISHAVTKGIRKDVEMKDSGIDWIGRIPKHWEVRRLKYIGKAENGLTYSPKDVCDESGVMVLRSSNIQNEKIDLSDRVYVKSAPVNLLVKKGDIIICSRNGSVSLVGKSALVEDDIYATFGAFMLRLNTKYYSKYIYFLVSDAIKHYKGLYSTTTINQLTLGMFSQMYAPFAPSIEEQKEIANTILNRTKQIECNITKAHKEISLLKEYRNSLITEVVTGKRKVI